MSTSTATDPRSAPRPAAGDRRRWWALLVIALGQLMVVFDVTIVNVALPSIGQALDISTGDRHWAITAYIPGRAPAASRRSPGGAGPRLHRGHRLGRRHPGHRSGRGADPRQRPAGHARTDRDGGTEARPAHLPTTGGRTS